MRIVYSCLLLLLCIKCAAQSEYQSNEFENISFTSTADTINHKYESALYLLSSDSTKLKGFNLRKSDAYYCIATDQKLSLKSIDTIYTRFDEDNGYTLIFKFNIHGSIQLADFTRSHSYQKVGFFINNKLLTAATLFDSINSGKMALTGDFTEEEANDIKSQVLSMIKK